ncbi:MAG: esterase-like activity of phytase family protein, partial [Flavisolibacter sp.]
MNYFLRFLAFCFFLISCTSQKNLSLTGKSHLKLLGEYDVPYNQSFNNTTIGGLSGIDYDNKHKLYYLISDDRSDINPSRFYTAKISISAKGIDSVVFVSVK